MKRTFWALLDDRTGSVGQARGVIQALDKDIFEICEKKIVYTKWAKLPNYLKGCSLVGVDKNKSSNIKEDLPDIVLSTSRRTAPVARWIKHHSKGKSRIVQLMHPGNCGLSDFDMVFVSEHDRNKKNPGNIIYFTGSPHRITSNTLETAQKKWLEIFEKMPKPLTAIIIGGAIKGTPFSEKNARMLGKQIQKLKKEIGGSILITSSRRTGERAQNIIKEAVKDIPANTFWWGEKKENPYMGYLACADNILITGDSVSMCCEACATNKPVWIFTGENWLTKKHIRFVNSLFAGKYATNIEFPKALEFKPEAILNPADFIAEKITNMD